MVVSPAFLAVDWGTTNRRVYAIDARGRVIDTARDDRGVMAIAPGGFDAEIAALRARWGSAPMLLAGMVGSTRGWQEAPYVPCPATINSLAANLVEVARDVAIVPGVCLPGPRGDVMRGEEVQLLGAVRAALAPDDALLCQPGTHCKWAEMHNGAIAGFRTTMTGEVYALLKQHSLLADYLAGEVAPSSAFNAGLDAARRRTLLGDLFAERANVLLDLCARNEVAAHVSGLLIGTDVLEQELEPGRSVHILADAALGSLYAAAVAAAGAHPVTIDSHAAFAAGITAIWSIRYA
jgi:2-dehydro-3-deoxygalactonokinase